MLTWSQTSQKQLVRIRECFLLSFKEYLHFTVFSRGRCCLFQLVDASSWTETPHLPRRLVSSLDINRFDFTRRGQSASEEEWFAGSSAAHAAVCPSASALFEVGAFFCRPVSSNVQRDHKSGVKINKASSSYDLQLLRRRLKSICHSGGIWRWVCA